MLHADSKSILPFHLAGLDLEQSFRRTASVSHKRVRAEAFAASSLIVAVGADDAVKNF